MLQKILLHTRYKVITLIDNSKIIYSLYICAKRTSELIVMPFRRFRYALFGKKVIDLKQVPIIINNYNRLYYLKLLIESLESRGYYNIHILDNLSTYPPLLEYYKTCKYNVIRLSENLGYCAIWRSKVYDQFKHNYYVYTDSDMQIDPNCPDDFMEKFMRIMNRKFYAQKVGFSLRIDDLPDTFANKNKVIEWEKKYWANEEIPGAYRANIDTTFALYRPYCFGAASNVKLMYRTDFPYVIKHLPWYIDSSNLTEEESFYVRSLKKSTHWSIQNR